MASDTEIEELSAVLVTWLAMSLLAGEPIIALIHAALANENRRHRDEADSTAQASTDEPGLMPTSDRFQAFLKLIKRDNPSLYRKLMDLD